MSPPLQGLKLLEQILAQTAKSTKLIGTTFLKPSPD